MTRLILLIAALLLPAAVIAAPQKPRASHPATAPATGTDWTRATTITPDGAFVLGNPRAPTRLIEYVSYTCPHCAHFMAEASGPLKTGWVKRGAVSIEIRSAIRDKYDLTAALLARCGGKARFFGDHEAIFATQRDWIAKVMAYEAAHQSDPPPAPGTDVSAPLVDIAQASGLSDLMAKRGIPLARQRQCIADKAALATLAAMANEAWQSRKIEGTPAFLLNGQAVDGVFDWEGLRPRLPAPGK